MTARKPAGEKLAQSLARRGKGAALTSKACGQEATDESGENGAAKDPAICLTHTDGTRCLGQHSVSVKLPRLA
jgi:hypothetical protein